MVPVDFLHLVKKEVYISGNNKLIYYDIGREKPDQINLDDFETFLDPTYDTGFKELLSQKFIDTETFIIQFLLQKLYFDKHDLTLTINDL